ncbi:SGNH/GDSL hydrolase family protein [Orbus mooreae]|uniref:SGNH/GDSL hydrolase family protein n=1 Tax=Orbus mooreae TaxID=3074107 RepID=UPI00370D5799
MLTLKRENKMMKKLVIFSFLMLFSIPNVLAATLLQGYVYTTNPVAHSLVVVRDSLNNTLITETDEQGFYQLDITDFVAPLIVSSDNNKLTPMSYQENQDSATHRVASFINTLQPNQINTVNLNSFTDYLLSELAIELDYIGPEQLIRKGLNHPVSNQILDNITQRFHQIFDDSLQQVGINPQHFDPMSTIDMRTNLLLALILHNRSYDSQRGEIGRTVLFDMRFRPITEQMPFDFNQATRDKNGNIKAEKRLFIVSDSTAANYDRKVYPRMGWGQVLEQFITEDRTMVVINGAQSGRSSRSFYNEGWFNLMAPFMQKGDYLIIAFGHNDEKCDSSKSERGRVDVMNLCTYPNDAEQNKQYPDGREDMSFQTSLERYIDLAKQKEMVPILMTPVTRFRNENNHIAYQNHDLKPVVSTHFTTNKSGFRYWGNYSDTIKYTAQQNDISLIDLEQLSINFANQHQQDWQAYWLVVDPSDKRYPYYKTQTSGVISNPDITHFQEKGALAVAQLIVDAIKDNPNLKSLSVLLDRHTIRESNHEVLTK